MKEYNRLLKKILEKNKDKIEQDNARSDRTGIGTYSIFGEQIRFDLNEGFPAITTKKLAWKAVVAELMWFLEGSTDERRLAELTFGKDRKEIIDKETIWTANCKDAFSRDPLRFSGQNVGNMYGYSWRSVLCEPQGCVKIKRKKHSEDYYEDQHICPVMTKEYKPVKVKDSNNYGRYYILGKIDKKFVIKFHNTGSYKIVNTITKNVKDLYAPSVEGVGYIGFEIPNTITAKKLHRVWQDMIIRVHNPRKNHKSYGEVSICKRWYNFQNFYSDCFLLKGFQEYVDSGYKWQLDKDYFGSNMYSPDDCIFLPPSLNRSLNAGGQNYKVYMFDNRYFYSKGSLNEYRGLTRKANLPEGLTVFEDNDEYVYRPIIFIDQISNALNLIKNDPNSRRILVDSWNSRIVQNAALAICHPMFQFYVKDNTLSCQVYIRSNDIFLGAPFNIASYALLTHIFARECNLMVGELIYLIGDAHIYSNHIDQTREQLTRVPFPLPVLKISENFNLSDVLSKKTPLNVTEFFTLEGYQSHPPIKAPMAV